MNELRGLYDCISTIDVYGGDDRVPRGCVVKILIGKIHSLSRLWAQFLVVVMFLLKRFRAKV